MALPITIPASPAAAGSPASTDGTNGPQTPSSPSNPQTLALPPPADPAAAPAPASAAAAGNAANANRRKPSRRANTAERRATHNAVERARRETLNGRFLDLAGLLPNLSQIRRPSKSSIVNSSIAHIHASRRHRLVAARELRLLKAESDALRRELNEWRDRSGLPRVEEPIRGDAFQMIMSGEVEILSAGLVEEEDGGDYGGDDYADDEFLGAQNGIVGSHVNIGAADDGPMDDIRAPMAHTATPALLKNPDPFAHSVPGSGLHLPRLVTRQSGHGNGTPMIVQSPTSVSFENPAMVSMYEPHHGGGGQYSGQYFGAGMSGEDKVSWHGSMYNGIANPGAGQQQPFSPPAAAPGQQRAYFMNMQRQQAMMQQQQQQQRQQRQRAPSGMGHVYGSPTDGDDASSVGSAPGGARRERSGSMGSNGSGYASPGSSGGYEVPRRIGGGGGGGGAPFGGDGMNMGMNGMGMGPGMMKSAPINVGGGGNGHGYASMML